MPEPSFLEKLLKAVPAVATVAGNIAGGSARGRAADAQNINTEDQLRNQQYVTQQGAETNAGNLDLSRKGFSEYARGGRASQAMLGDILSNWQPTSIDVPGVKSASISGGLGASMGPMSKAAGAELSRQALLKLMEGDEFSGGAVLPKPGISDKPQAGTFEKVMGGIGTGGSLLGSLAELFPSKGAPAPVPFVGVNGPMASLPGSDQGAAQSSSLADILKKLQQYAAPPNGEGY